VVEERAAERGLEEVVGDDVVRMAGTVQVEISVEPTGRISEVVVVRSSSHEMLDSAALDAVRALRQIPFPPGVRPRAIRVRLPIVFELR